MASPFPPSVQTAAAVLGIDVSQIGQQEVELLTQILAASSAIASGGGGGSGITQLTGDVTAGPGSGSVAATLATVNSNVGSFTNANITVDAKGRVTAAANGSGVTIPGTISQVLTSDGAGGVTATGVTIDPSTGAITTPNNGKLVSSAGSLIIGVTANDFICIGTDLNVGRQRDGGFIIGNGLGLLFGSGAIFSGVDSGILRTGSANLKITDGTTGFGSLSVGVSDAATNTVVTALTLTHATSATAAAGLGVAEVFQLPSDAGTIRSAGQINVQWTSPTNAAEASSMNFQTMLGGSLTNQIQILSTGVMNFAQLSDDLTVHVQNGSFFVQINGAPRRVLTADP